MVWILTQYSMHPTTSPTTFHASAASAAFEAPAFADTSAATFAAATQEPRQTDLQLLAPMAARPDARIDGKLEGVNTMLERSEQLPIQGLVIRRAPPELGIGQAQLWNALRAAALHLKVEFGRRWQLAHHAQWSAARTIARAKVPSEAPHLVQEEADGLEEVLRDAHELDRLQEEAPGVRDAVRRGEGARGDLGAVRGRKRDVRGWILHVSIFGQKVTVAVLSMEAQRRAVAQRLLVPDEGGHQRSSEVIRGHQRSSEVIRGQQRSTEVIRGQQRSSEVIRESPDKVAQRCPRQGGTVLPRQGGIAMAHFQCERQRSNGWRTNVISWGVVLGVAPRAPSGAALGAS